MRFSVYQESHVGGRKNNQDRMGYSFSKEALILLLADGMGGHIQGERAAAIAVQTISSMFHVAATPTIDAPGTFFEESFFAAHREIHRYRDKHGLPDTPRTTIVACLIQNNSAYWAHCGDSRLYWLRQGEVLARTRDHSQFEALVAQGKVNAAQRTSHPDRNKIFNCLGAPGAPVVEFSTQAALRIGDVILLCSDGLWSVLPDQVITQHLHRRSVMRAVPDMLAAAVRIGGETGDNVTALAMMWEGGDAVEDRQASADTTSAGEDTRIKAGMSTVPPDDVDDVEVEKAIAEIRNAIEKTSRLTNNI